MSKIIVQISTEPADALAALQSDEEVISHILSALYGRMGDFGWRSVVVKQFEHKDI